MSVYTSVNNTVSRHYPPPSPAIEHEIYHDLLSTNRTHADSNHTSLICPYKLRAYHNEEERIIYRIESDLPLVREVERIFSKSFSRSERFPLLQFKSRKEGFLERDK